MINKIDLEEVVGFDREACLRNVRSVNPQARILLLSARSGAGLEG